MDNKESIYNKLNEMNIDYYVINHKAMFSEEDTDFNEFDNNIMLGKNLFLRNDKKNKYYLVCIPLMKKANLLKLASFLGEKRLSFANEKELDEYLSITPGSVSYLNIITAEKLGGNFKDVIYILDKELIDASKIGFHPSDNTATVVTNSRDMIKVFEKYDLNYYILDL